MPVYSQDLRQRVIDTVERGEGSLRQVARRFLVSLSFVTRLLRHYRDTGAVEPKPHRGGRPPALGPADLERLQQWEREQPDATLEELRQRLGIDCSLMAISRAPRERGLQPPGDSDGASAPANHAPTAASRYANTERPC